MDLATFLSTASADNQTALEEALLETTTGSRMISPDMMLAYITNFSLVDTLLISPTTNEAKAVQVAFNFGSEFNLINGHPAAITSILDILITDSIVTESFKSALVAYANPLKQKFPGITLDDVKAIRQPATLTQCDHGVQGFLVSNSYKDKFLFTVQTTAPTPNIPMTMWYRSDSSSDWVKYSSPIILKGDDGLYSPPAISRPSGLNAARHLMFEYTAKYAGLITSIVVSKGQ